MQSTTPHWLFQASTSSPFTEDAQYTQLDSLAKATSLDGLEAQTMQEGGYSPSDWSTRDLTFLIGCICSVF